MSTPSRVIVEGKPESGFSLVPNHLVRCPNLRHGPRTAVLWLASRGNDWKVVIGYAAEELHVDPDTFSGWLRAAAEDTDWLTLEPLGTDRQGNPTYVYRVHLDATCSPNRKFRCGGTETFGTREDTLKKTKTFSGDFQSPADFPTLLPASWRPNHTHRVTARQRGLDIRELTEAFCVDTGEKRKDWDRTFAGYINAVADEREDTEYSSWEEYEFTR